MSIPNHQIGDDYQSTFENAMEGIFQSSIEGRLLKVNPAMASIYGYDSPEDMITSIKTVAKQIYVDVKERNRFLKLLQADGHVEKFEAQNYRKDGSVIWTQTNAQIVKDLGRNAQFIEGFVTEVTSHKEAEFALRASEERYRVLVERLPAVIFLDETDELQTTLYISPKIKDLLGYSPNEWMADPYIWENSLHPDDKERVLAEDHRTNQEGGVFITEYRLRKKDGNYSWIREESSLILDVKGKPLYWQGFLSDITEQKWAERTLQKSGEQFKQVFKANPLASCIATLSEGRIVAANDAYWKMSGYQPKELLGHTSIELGFMDADSRHDLIERLKTEKSIKNLNGKLITNAGETRETLEFYEVIEFNRQDCILSMFYDVTEQISAQNAVKDNEEKYRQLFEAESDAIFLIDNETGKILEANSAASTLYGYSREELLDKKNSDLSAEPTETRKVTQETPVNLTEIIVIPYRLHKKKDGTVFPVEITGRFFEWRGRPVHIAAVRDITERKKFEAALLSSEERFRLAFQTSPDAININRMEDGLYVDVNEGFTVMTGFTREETIGKTSKEINIWVNSEDRIKLIDGLKKNGVVDNLEAKFRIKGGDIASGLMSAKVIELNGIPHIISITRNIETLKKTEETLQRQLKDLTILHNIASAASSSTNVDDLIQHTTDIIADALFPVNCGVELVTEGGDMYQTHPSYRGASKKEVRLPTPLTKGVTGKVITTGTPVRVGDVTQEPAYIEVTKGVHSELCVPIKIQERVIGVINIESKQANAFDEADERLLNTIAGTLATTIEQLRLFETVQRRLQELSSINAVALASTRSTNVDELIENITQIIGDTLYPDNFGVLLMSESDKALYPHPSYRGVNTRNFPSRVPIGQGVSGQVASSRKPLRIANVRKHKGYIEVTSQVRSELCVPIIHGETILGVINAESVRINLFTEDDERLLITIASTMATAIERLRLLEDEKRRRQDADILREATVSLTKSLQLATLLDVILENLSRIVAFDSASIALLEDNELRIFAGRGFPENYNIIGNSLSNNGKWTTINIGHPSLIIPDVHANPEFEQWDGSDYIRGWMGVALILQDKIIGYIFLDSSAPDYFTQRDATMIETFASSAAVAIENARLFAEEQEQRQRSMALLDLMRIATSSLELDKVLHAILSYTTRLIPSDSGTIQLIEKGTLRVATAIGHEVASSLPEKVIPIDRFPINAEIIREKQPTRIIDVATDTRFTKIPGTEKIRSFLGIPLTIKNKVIGLITLDSYTPNNFSDSDMVLALAIANHAAFAIENARLFEAEQQQYRESETLRQAALAISTSLELENVLETILIVMKQVIPFDSSSVLLEAEGRQLLHIAALQGFSDPESLLEVTFPTNDGLYQEIKANGQPIILEDAQNDTRFHSWGKTEGVRNWMGVPLTVRGETIGCITLDSLQSNVFNAHLAALAQAFANQAASAIQNARQFEAEQRHFQEAETLRQVSEAITSTLNIQQVLDSILENLNRVVPFDSATVFLIENENVRMMAIRGVSDPSMAINSIFPADNALFQEIWNSGMPLILDDCKEDSRFEAWVVGRVRGWMGVPLIARGMIVGYITIDSQEIGVYDNHHATLAMTFAHQAAVAIENARLYERSEQQIRQLTILREVDSAISSSFDLRVTLNLLISHITRELGADAAAILLYNSDLQALSYYTSIGLALKRNATTSNLRIGECLAGQVALRRKFMHIPNLNDSPENQDYLHYIGDNFAGYFGFPLIGKGQLKGVLEIYTKENNDPSSEWISFMHTLAGQAAIAIDNIQLFKNLQRSNQELTLAYDSTLKGWGRALELRDKETKGHSDRVVELTMELARRMGVQGEELTNVLRGTLLHDIGKMGIPDRILRKPGPLTEKEWKIMRQHPQYAYDLIYPIPYLRPAVDIPYGHHERWDGSGYPRGLKGEEIPLAARIFAVVDTWDALLYDRVYRAAWPAEKVIEYLKSTAGIELDPTIVEKFLELIEEDRYKNQAE